MSNHTTALALPVTVTVADNGAVLVTGGSRCVAMSLYSERATRLSRALPAGEHTVATDADVASLPDGVAADLADCLDC